LVTRDPQRQVELFDIVIGFAVHVVSATVYDEVRSLISAHVAAKRVQVVPSTGSDTSSPEQNAPGNDAGRDETSVSRDHNDSSNPTA
jgi:hypothetical protein